MRRPVWPAAGAHAVAAGRGQEPVRTRGHHRCVPHRHPRPAPLRRAHGPLRRVLLAALRRVRPRRPDAQDATVRIVLMHAWGVGGTIRTVLTLAGALAEHHDVEVLSVVRRRDDPHFPFPPGVTVSAIDDQRPGRPARFRPAWRAPRSPACPASSSTGTTGRPGPRRSGRTSA